MLFAITDGDMTQMEIWDGLEIHDFFAKLEAHRAHIINKAPKKKLDVTLAKDSTKVKE